MRRALLAALCMISAASAAEPPAAGPAGNTPGVAAPAAATPAVARPPALSADAATRQRFLDGYKRTLAEAGWYLKLQPAQMQRLCELLADRQLAWQQVYVRNMVPGMYDVSFVPGIYRESIEREFGAAVAERWARYEDLRSGLGFVDRIVSRFYDADAPLSAEQRWKLAASYQRNILGVTGETTGAADNGSLLAGTVGMERRLAEAERRVAATLADARGFLTPAQGIVLSDQLEATLLAQRETVRQMRAMADAMR